MTREEAKTMLPIIQAYAEGKEIEIFDKTMKMWKTAMLPHFDCDSKNYRIKPGVKYRPFANAEECWQEMQKHQPFGFTKFKNAKSGYYMVTFIASGATVGMNNIPFCYEEMFDSYTFADGTPFGIKEEE